MNQYFDHINPFNCSNFSIAEKLVLLNCHCIVARSLARSKVDNFSLLINHLLGMNVDQMMTNGW